MVKKRLKAIKYLDADIGNADIPIIAVGTPFDGRKIYLRFVEEASLEIGTE